MSDSMFPAHQGSCYPCHSFICALDRQFDSHFSLHSFDRSLSKALRQDASLTPLCFLGIICRLSGIEPQLCCLHRKRTSPSKSRTQLSSIRTRTQTLMASSPMAPASRSTSDRMHAEATLVPSPTMRLILNGITTTTKGGRGRASGRFMTMRLSTPIVPSTGEHGLS